MVWVYGSIALLVLYIVRSLCEQSMFPVEFYGNKESYSSVAARTGTGGGIVGRDIVIVCARSENPAWLCIARTDRWLTNMTCECFPRSVVVHSACD